GITGFLTALLLFVTVRNEGIQVLYIGGWVAPFGITFVVDLMSAIMVLVTATMGLLVAVYALADINPEMEALGYHPLFFLLLAGVSGSFLTGDLFNLYVWFEIMLITSFVLLVMQGTRSQLEGAVKYVTLSLISSALFLSAIGLLYGLVGTLNMADIAQKMDVVAQKEPVMVTAVSLLFLVAFGIKSALFPLFGWLPSSYHTPPTAVTTIFGALLTKVGVYAILRLFTLIFVQNTAVIQPIILALAAMTMVTGVFGAVVQYDFRRLLSFHIISQIGYLIMGIGLMTLNSLAGTIFFMVHVIFAKSALFLVSGVVNRLQGTYYLKHLGGLYKRSVPLSLLFFIPAMALAGIPPLSGFWAKFSLIFSGLEAGQYLIVAVALFVSVWTLYSMTKIWTYVYWRPRPSEYEAPLTQLSRQEAWFRIAPAAVLGLLTLLMGLFAGPLFAIAVETATQLLDRQGYITAVLGGM
ncbi:MAG: Na+/H+ antiporter subunit D, partial [Anaerolineales bacterium]|nr:Na+/H+ antiporter subunit D [Anaerolineales bacterium]